MQFSRECSSHAKRVLELHRNKTSSLIQCSPEETVKQYLSGRARSNLPDLERKLVFTIRRFVVSLRSQGTNAMKVIQSNMLIARFIHLTRICEDVGDIRRTKFNCNMRLMNMRSYNLSILHILRDRRKSLPRINISQRNNFALERTSYTQMRDFATACPRQTRKLVSLTTFTNS